MEETASSFVEEGTKRSQLPDYEVSLLHSKFGKLIEENDTPGEERAKLYAEIEKISLVQIADDTLSFNRRTSEREQVVLFAANRCCTLLHRLGHHNAIDDMSVPTLLEIMCNSTLFRSELEYIIKFSDAYMGSTCFESGLDILWNELKSTMLLLLDNIDQTVLPERDRFIERVKRMQKPSPPIKIPRCLCELQDLKTAGSHFDDEENIKRMCGEGKEWKNGRWTYPEHKVHCFQCKILFEHVIKNQLSLNYDAGLQNCKKKPVGGSWGIAKLFMPKH